MAKFFVQELTVVFRKNNRKFKQVVMTKLWVCQSGSISIKHMIIYTTLEKVFYKFQYKHNVLILCRPSLIPNECFNSMWHTFYKFGISLGKIFSVLLVVL